MIHGSTLRHWARESGRLARSGLLVAAFATNATPSDAHTITLNYIVTITERAPLIPITSGPRDDRIGLSPGPFEPYDAVFPLTMSFDVLLGDALGVGFGSANYGLFTVYGTPTFSTIPLARALPLVTPGDASAETDVRGQAFEQQAFDSLSGESYTNWGAYLLDVVRVPTYAETGSTTLLTHIRPSNFTDPSEFSIVPLDTYLGHMRSDLEFDFVTWSLFRTTDNYSQDSYVYRGTASPQGTPVPDETWTFALLGLGVTIAVFTHRRLRVYPD